MFPIVPDATPAWWYITAMSLSVLLVGVAKAGFGGGIALLAVPLLASALDSDRALGVMLPLLILGDLFSNTMHWGRHSWPHLRWLLTGALTGILMGSFILKFLQETGHLTTALNLLVGSICLFFVLVQCYRLAGGKVPRIPPGPWGGRTSGLAAGVTSTLAHSAGPIVSIYLLEQRLDKRVLVSTMLLFALIGNLAKLPGYVLTDVLNTVALRDVLWFGPLMPLGAALGLWMHKRIPEKPFTVVLYVGAAIAAANMLYKAFAGG